MWVLVGSGVALAQEGAKLLTVTKHSGVNSTRISFQFTQLPGFEVQSSGQKVDVTFRQATAADSVQLLPSNGDIVDSLMASQDGSLTVSILLRRPPEAVESMTVGDTEVQLNLIWPSQASRTRPGMTLDPGGMLQMGQGEAVVGRFLTSQYSGKWDRFFAEYEPPVDLDVGMHFTRMPYPLAMGQTEAAELPENIRQAAKEEEWDRALAYLQEASSEPRKEYPGLTAELLLRFGRVEEAHDIMTAYLSGKDASRVSARLRLLRIYILLAQKRPYLAYCYLFSENAPQAVDSSVDRFWRLAQVETALDTGRPGQSLDLAGELRKDSSLSQAGEQDKLVREVAALRRIQALLARGERGTAWEEVQSLPISLARMLKTPQAMAKLAGVYYERKRYDRARPFYNQLGTVLSPEEGKATALWRAGMCLQNSKYPSLAKRLLRSILDDYPDTPGGFRARMSLTDMALQRALPQVSMETVANYQVVADTAPVRSIREEAEFKRVVALYLLGELEQSVDALSRFLIHYAAGPLYHQARALLVEQVPQLVPMLFKDNRVVEGLAMVAEHRDLLVKSDLPQDFLLAMGDTFAELNLVRRGARVYLYMLSRAGNEDEQGKVYARLIQLWSKADMTKELLQYADLYATKFPRGRYRADILTLAAKGLLDRDEPNKALEHLLASGRPVDRDLDVLTARALFTVGEYERMDRYLERARMPQRLLPAEIRFAWARAKSAQGEQKQALDLFQALGQGETKYALPALYHSAEILAQSGHTEAAIKTYQELADTGEGTLWAELAREGRFVAENADLVDEVQ